MFTQNLVPEFIAALFITVPDWKQPKRPSNGKWINRLEYSLTMQAPSAMKRNEILMQETAWINLKSIMLSVRGQTQRV